MFLNCLGKSLLCPKVLAALRATAQNVQNITALVVNAK
jgi:hypothetical protein